RLRRGRRTPGFRRQGRRPKVRPRRDLGICPGTAHGGRAGIMSEPMTAEEITRYVVARAIWAPSVHNTQPWRFTADGGPHLRLYADASRRLTAADPDGREMMISCGAALFSVRLALRSLGYIPETSVLPDPGQPTLVAQVSWRERAAADEFERRLSAQLLTRPTHRGAFDPQPLRPDTPAAPRSGAARARA